MKVILSNMCASLVGTLEKGLGYHLEQRKNGFFAKRDQRGSVPPDGHWRFIVLCAELAQNKLHITDIEVKQKELRSALREARLFVAANHLKLETYHARDILNLKTTFGL